MPDWPRPPDVEFDTAAAQTAVAELRAAARTLTDTEGARTQATTTARTDFQGAYATSFGDGSSGLDQEATAALEGLSLLGQTIETAIDDAARRRREVEALQAEWDAQAEAERRLAVLHPNVPL